MAQTAEVDRFFRFISAGPDAADLRAPVQGRPSAHAGPINHRRTVGFSAARVADAPPGGCGSDGRRSS